MKFLILALTTFCLTPVAAFAHDLDSKLLGTFSTNERNFVTVKRLTFNQDKNGNLKVHGTLVGFPDEVAIGDASPRIYFNKSTGTNALLASFSSDKYKPTITINPAIPSPTINSISFTCFMRDIDGKDIWFTGNLKRE